MAVVEIQFREGAFLDLVGSEALRPPLSHRVLEEVARRVGDEDAILRLADVTWAEPPPPPGTPGAGSVVVRVDLAIDLTDTPGRLEGAPVGPVVVSRQVHAHLTLRVWVSTGLCYELIDLFVGAPVPLAPMAPAPLLLSGDRPVRDHDMHDITVDHGTVLAERGTVSIRLAMDHRDDVRGPVEPNLEHHDWSWFIPGELVAGAVASAVDDALDTAMAWPDAGIRVDERTTVLWRYRDASQPAAHAAGLRSGPVRASRMVRLARAGGLADARAAGPADPVAVATARLVATEALSCGSDLPFTLSAETHLRIAWPESGAGTPSLVTMTLVRVESDEPDVLEVLAPLELLRDELRAGFDSRLDSRPAGAMATDQGSGALRIDTERPVTAPMTRAWIGIVASAELGAGGMLVAGPLALRQPGELGARPRRGHEWAVLRGERDRGSHNGDRPDEPGGNGSVLA